MDNEELRRALCWGSVGFGVTATFAPRVFASVYGLKKSPELQVMTRLWGTRNIVLGAIGLLASGDDEIARLTKLTIALNVADSAIIANAGPEVKTSSRVMGALTTAGFAGAFGYVLTS